MSIGSDNKFRVNSRKGWIGEFRMFRINSKKTCGKQEPKLINPQAIIQGFVLSC